MAVRDGSTPLFENISGGDAKPENDGSSSDDPQRDNSTALIRVVERPPELHRMHEGRVVKSAGRMLVGSPAPIPTLEDVLSHTPIFSGRKARQWSVSGGVAVVLACVVAIGAAVALTGVLSRNVGHGAAAQDGRGGTTGRAGAGPAPQSLTMSEIGTGSRTARPGSRTARPGSAGGLKVAKATDARGASGQAGAFTVKDVTGTADKALPLRITIPQTGPEEYSFIMFRGLPAKVRISSGFRLKDSWAVSLRDLDSLTLEAEAGYAGQFKLEVLLIRGRDKPAQSRALAVDILAPGGQVPVTAENAASQVLTAAPAAEDTGSLLRVSPEEEAPLLEKASKLLESYNISSARLLFEHLARQGSAKAAFGLAQTFDPSFFHSSSIRGMRPDAAKAKQWYKWAAKLGNEEAVSRLSALDAR